MIRNLTQFFSENTKEKGSRGVSFAILMIHCAVLSTSQKCVRKMNLKNMEICCRRTTEATIPNLVGENEGNDAKLYRACSALWPAFEPSAFRTKYIT